MKLHNCRVHCENTSEDHQVVSSEGAGSLPLMVAKQHHSSLFLLQPEDDSDCSACTLVLVSPNAADGSMACRGWGRQAVSF